MDRPVPPNLTTRPHGHPRSEHMTKRQLFNHLEDEHGRWIAGGTYSELVAAHKEHDHKEDK